MLNEYKLQKATTHSTNSSMLTLPEQKFSSTCNGSMACEVNACFCYDNQESPIIPQRNGVEMVARNAVITVTGDELVGDVGKNRKINGYNAIRTFLVLLVTSILMAFIVILVLYVTGSQYNTRKTSSAEESCFTEDCIFDAADILGSMNQSVDPCEDFYSFSCGGWQQKTFIPATDTSIHILSTLLKSNKDLLRNLLGDASIRAKYSKNRAVIKTIDFYQTCVREDIINEQGISYLKTVIEHLGGSNITTADWNSTEYDVNNAVITAFREFAVQPFFTTQIFGDFKNSSIRRFAVTEGGIVLAKTFYLQTNSTEEFYTKRRKVYKEFMVKVMELFGVDGPEAERQMQQVFLLEEKIAETTKLTSAGPTMMTIEKLTNITKYDWLSFFTGLTVNQNYTITKDEFILIQSTGMIAAVTAIINDTDKAVLSNYIVWTVMEAIVEHLPSKYGDARLAYYREIHGPTYDSERWDTCLEFVKVAFPMSIGLMFVDKKLTPQAKERAAEIFEEIRHEFLNELKDQTWMDEETREKAREKAEAMTLLVGYPDYIRDEEKLHAKYNQVQVDKDKYLETVFNMKKFSFLEKVADLKHPVDKKSFDYSPADVNAYHYQQENKNVFLAGILLPPIYDPTSLRAANYGGIGMIAGHELTHGFDARGRGFDKDGNIADWWTKNSTMHFINKSKCLEDQYSQYELYGKKLNGKISLGENIADNGGLKFAYEAYQRWTEKNGNEDKLPGLDFTPNQLFFISYAQVWCAKYTRDAALSQLDNKPWPPMSIRVLGNIRNSEPFSKAFNCKIGSRMNPAKKCSLW